MEAVKLNLSNRKEYPIEILRGKFKFAESECQFKREKYRFCIELADKLGI